MKKGERARGTLLQIAQLGSEVIREKAREVKSAKDPQVQKLIDVMVATCLDVDGVGIAAPQVYKSLSVFIVASHPNSRYPKAPRLKPFAVINPKIITRSSAKTKDWEGCLSIPGIRGIIPRHNSITVEYVSKGGKKVREKLTGFVARIFQHEYDHLQGIVIVDRAQPKDLIAEKEYQKIVSTYLRS